MRKTWLALLSIYIIWGSTYLAIRLAVDTIPPFLMAATRMLTAGIILFVWMRLRGAKIPSPSEWRAAGITGLLLLLGGNGLLSAAEQRVPSSIAALLIGSVPLWIVLIDAVRPGGRRPSVFTFLGIAAGLVGIMVLIDPFSNGSSRQPVDLFGALLLLAASIFWSIGSIYGREHHSLMPKEPLMTAGVQMLVGGAGLLLAGTLLGEWGRLDLANVSLSSLLGLAYLIFFGSIIAFASYSWLLGAAPTPLVATYAYVNPLVAVILGNLIANEPVDLRIILSTVLIVGAVILINMASWLKATGRLQARRVSRTSV